MTEKHQMTAAEKAERDKRSAAGRAESTKVKRTKEYVYDLEKTNRKYIIIYRSGSNWWKMGGNSALYFAYVLARRLKNYRLPKVRPDTDYYYKFETGTVSLKDVDGLVHRLTTELGLKLAKETEYIRVLELEYKMTDSELKRLKDAEHKWHEQANQIVVPENIYPELYFQLERAYTDFCHVLAKMTRPDRVTFGDRIEQLGHRALMDYYHLANGELEVMAGLKSIIFNLSEMTYALKELAEVGVMERERMMRESLLVLEAKDIAKRALKRLEKEALKEEEDGKMADKTTD